MAQVLVKNNAFSTLAAGITASATSITIAVGHGSRFPTIAGGNVFYATLINASNVLEIIKVVGRAGDVLTVTRGQDGTVGTAYLLGDRIELRPTAALFDDKLSKGGGIMTGPIEIPAGAVTTQVPQIQEVVRRIGDTMTGPLTLPTIQGTSGIVNLPTANKFIGADIGSIYAPGMVVQTGYLRSDNVTTYAYTSAAGNVESFMELTDMQIVFTPLFATSKLLLMYSLFGDASTFNFTFALDRNGTKLRNAAGSAATRWYGIAGSGYLTVDSRPEQFNFFYLDSPASAAAQTYKLLYQASNAGANAQTYYQNRPAGGVPASQFEGGISQVYIQEITQ